LALIATPAGTVSNLQ